MNEWLVSWISQGTLLITNLDIFSTISVAYTSCGTSPSIVPVAIDIGFVVLLMYDADVVQIWLLLPLRRSSTNACMRTSSLANWALSPPLTVCAGNTCFMMYSASAFISSLFVKIWSAAFKYLCVLPTNPAGAPVVRDVANIESLLNSSPIAGVTNPDQSSVYVWPLDPSKWTNNLAFVSPWKIPVGEVNAEL